VLVLSASGEQADVLEAVKAGATGYLVKSASAAELVDAVRRTAAGDAVFTSGLAGLVLGEYRRTADDAAAPKLTVRETEVLRLVAKGLTAKQVAERLVLSHRTVENHVQNTLSKLQLHNRAQLVRYAVEKGSPTSRRPPDGRRLAWRASRSGGRQWARAVGGPAARRVSPPGSSAASPAWPR
jgi:DNA-binding NarL/FixJ family response regulator